VGSAILAAGQGGSATGSGVRQLRCPGAAVHVTRCARLVTVRLHDPVEFSVDVVFSALFAEKATSTEKATSKAGVGLRRPLVRGQRHEPGVPAGQRDLPDQLTADPSSAGTAVARAAAAPRVWSTIRPAR
jgi:hypothetical protein